MKNFFMNTKSIVVCSLVLQFFIFNSCQKFDPENLQITAVNNITGYLEEHTDQFSSLLEMLNRDITLSNGNTIKYSSFLNAYAGNYNGYTLFAPTNDAIDKYLAKRGYASISEIPNDTIKKILDFHLLADTVSTTSFTDGKLSVATFYGQYLIVGSYYDGSSTRIRVNKQAYITTKNISLGNGIVHVIDGVLEPAVYTTAQLLENDGRFKIFVEALKATGYYDTLNVANSDMDSVRWLSVMATSDSVYNANSIYSYDDLYKKYSNTGAPLSSTDSLHLYIGYHILEGLKFIADLNSSVSYSTLSSGNVIIITTSGDTVVVNRMTVNNVYESGVTISRAKSDNSSLNGVWHFLNDDYYIKKRTLSRVFFDFCDYTNIRNKVSYWGKSYSTTVELYNTSIDGISYYAKNGMSSTYLYYVSNTATSTSASSNETFVNYNYLYVHMGTTRISWIKFTTPFIAAGEYKVWLAYRRTGKTCPISVMIDSVDMNNSTDLMNYLPARNSRTLDAYDNYLLGIGYKRPYQMKDQKNYANRVNVGFYLGKITLTTSSTHWVKVYTTAAGSTGSKAYLDYIEFIPVDDDQIWPKYDQDGTAWARPADGYDDTKTAIY